MSDPDFHTRTFEDGAVANFETDIAERGLTVYTGAFLDSAKHPWRAFTIIIPSGNWTSAHALYHKAYLPAPGKGISLGGLAEAHAAVVAQTQTGFLPFPIAQEETDVDQ